MISAWAYADRETLKKKLHYYGFPDSTVARFEVVNDALFVVAKGDVVRSKCGKVAIVAFRGTEPVNLISWLTDADVITRPLTPDWIGEGRVHRGFFVNVEAVWDDVLRELRQGSAPEVIYVTGHSLGGAMAVLAATQLRSMDEFKTKMRGVYTYGQPAVGDQTFADWGTKTIGSMLYRHVYHHDLVPQLPPTTTGYFVHFGHEHRSTGRHEDEITWTCSENTRPVRFALWAGLGALLEFAARRTTLFDWIPFPNSIGDHSPAFYVNTSRNYARATTNACLSTKKPAPPRDAPPARGAPPKCFANATRVVAILCLPKIPSAPISSLSLLIAMVEAPDGGDARLWRAARGREVYRSRRRGILAERQVRRSSW